MDAAAGDAPRSGAPRRGWQRRVRRTRALGPAYFSVAVRWAAWGMALAIVFVVGPPRYELRLADVGIEVSDSALSWTAS